MSLKYYKEFMDRQTVSEAGHARLLNLEQTSKRARAPWGRWGLAAACAGLAVAIAIGAGLANRPGEVAANPLPGATQAPNVDPTAAPGLSSDCIGEPPAMQEPVNPDAPAGFTAQGPADGGKLMLPMIAGVDYADVTGGPQVSASLVLPDGAFGVNLSKEDIQKLFWGPDGKPPVENPKTDPGDFPLLLMNWAGYEITGEATYDGNGDLWELSVRGTKGEDSFALRAAPGRIPPTCCVERGAVTTDVLGVEVSGWYRSYDRDGDDEVEHVCTSEFLANGVGFRFENVGSGGMKAGQDVADDLGGAMRFNQMTVTQLCHVDGFWLDEFARNDNIPSWVEENYDTIDQAVDGAENFALGHPEADFLAYLPTEGPDGYGEFHARLSYQEGVHKTFFVRWTHGYDNVEVDVQLPEGDSGDWLLDDLVDVNVPESYDWRLYDGAISDVVPEEYRQSFYAPVFRGADMSLEVVEARMNDHDTGGRSCHFWVLHEDGTVVSYSCSGVSAQYVWSLVERTLGEG